MPMGDLAGGAFNSLAWGASTYGNVIVGVGTSASGSEAFRSVGGSMTGLGDLPGGTFSSEALDVSNNGLVIVGSGTSASGQEAFRWENGVIVGLGDLTGGSFGSVARGVSANGGVIVGEAQSASGTEAFRWENGVMTGLGDLPGGNFQSSAYDVSADGSVIVGSGQRLYPYGNRDEAFRWKAGVMTGLGTLSSAGSFAKAVSGDGSVIVGSVGTGINGTAFIWDEEHGMRDLETVVIAALGSQLGIDFIYYSKLLEATGISDDGSTIVGWGENSYGRGEAWIFVIPEPASGVLVFSGLTLLAALRRQRSVVSRRYSRR
jgi:probable HAF family extracellular repeat protein